MTTLVTHHRKFLTLLGVGLALAFLIACSAQPTSATGAPGNQLNPTVAPVSNSVSGGDRVNAMNGSGAGFPSTFASSNGQLTGISVSGQGVARGNPDTATINLGVEASRDTVQVARDDAAAAMGQVIEVLRQQGIADEDIRTSHFSIYPRYDRNGQTVTGFVVSNQVTVKVRNIDNVGAIIDTVTGAGGDLTRFQGISFSIEDTKLLESQARAAAVTDLMAKANQLAELNGVRLGGLVSIAESGGGMPIFVAAERAAFDQAAAAPTPIMAGEMDVTINLQAVFAIEPAQ